MRGLNRASLGFLTLVPSFIFALSAIAQTPQAVNHSDSSHYSYLKFSLFPFIYEATRPSVPYLWISLQYESQFNHKKHFTYNLAIEYISHGGYKSNVTFTGPLKEVAIRPQVRFYVDRKIYRGYYFGLFPIYYFSGGEYSVRTGHYWGAGAITGYQYFIRKIPIELNIGTSYQAGGVTLYYDEFNMPYTKPEGFWRGTLEVNIGLPIRKKR